MESVRIANLQIHPALYAFVKDEVLPGLGLGAHQVWEGFSAIVEDLAPKNAALIAKRDTLQQQIDEWHKARSANFDAAEYQAFLREIGYLQPVPEKVQIEPGDIDDEIASIAGPQLVVPVNNARYALNAANARWGSLYDALYGTDVIAEDNGQEKGKSFNPVRGQAVFDYVNNFLDQAAPLQDAKYADVASIKIEQVDGFTELRIKDADGNQLSLQDPKQFVAFASLGKSVLLRNNGLHIELQIDVEDSVGALHPFALKDVLLESAITTIQDCEDSVAAVDAEDKVGVYRNWLGLMKGDLNASFSKQGSTVTREMSADREYVGTDGGKVELSGRSLLLVRNVGHLMTIDAVMDAEGNQIPEGILDALVTSLIAMHDLNGNSRFKNSKKGNVYIVKPKMHGPEEVAFTVELFGRVEQALGLPENTLKVGIMDEERRTSANLKACIEAAKNRVIFINTGFLDRTGDEIHTSMEAGPMLPKATIKAQPWISTYEDRNVQIGLSCGFKGKAQIGKGMWAMPDQMSNMMEAKIGHPNAGANCAWVPSPTAATLHVMHYHQVKVSDVQEGMMGQEMPADSLDKLLTVPLMADAQRPSAEEIERELDNNVQGILGYVVRWIDQGVGCSKVPDINDVGLMEDRATLRISSQHIANWLHHGICTEDQVKAAFERMAATVDAQNANDANYLAMAPNFQGLAYQAASDLVFKGREQPSGYTEPLLHGYRYELKHK